MPNYEPIPTPAALHWREFRVKALPILTFAITIVVCVAIWSRHVVPSSLLGQAVSAQASISSAAPGMLVKVSGDVDQPVRAGQTIATVMTTSPRLLEANLAVIEAEAELIRLGMNPLADVERNELNLERLKLDLLQQRTALALARVQLEYADAEFLRINALRDDPSRIVSVSDHEIATRDRGLAREEVRQLEETVKSLSAALEKYEAGRPATTADHRETVTRQAIEAQQRQLELIEAEMGPVELTAPIDGVITAVLRRAGENVVAGEPIVTILSTNVTGIVAYIPQTVPFEVRAGMETEVRRQGSDRSVGAAKVTRVGAYFTPVPVSLQLAPPVNGQTNLLGLPLWVSVPVDLPLRPGEIVGLRVIPAD